MKTTRPLSLLIAILLMFGSLAYAEETQLAATTVAQSTYEISEQNKANFDNLINNIESNLVSSETSTNDQTLTVAAPIITTTNTSANANNVQAVETKISNTENTSSPNTIPNNTVATITPSDSLNSNVNINNTSGANTTASNPKTSATPPPAEKKSGFSLVEVLQLAASVASLLITIY